MKTYEFIDDLTSDIMFKAYGGTLKELFINAGTALLKTICKIKEVKPKKEIEFSVEGKTKKDLLYSFLSEIIARVDTEEMFFSKIEIDYIDDTKIKGKLYGESITPEKGETSVKAVTYYKFNLIKSNTGYVASVVLDV